MHAGGEKWRIDGIFSNIIFTTNLVSFDFIIVFAPFALFSPRHAHISITWAH